MPGQDDEVNVIWHQNPVFALVFAIPGTRRGGVQQPLRLNEFACVGSEKVGSHERGQRSGQTSCDEVRGATSIPMRQTAVGIGSKFSCKNRG